MSNQKHSGRQNICPCDLESSEKEVAIVTEDEQFMIDFIIERMKQNKHNRHLIYYFASEINND